MIQHGGLAEGRVSRRSALRFGAAGILWFARPNPIQPGFWNQKPAAEWSAEEVDFLITHSPWAQEVDLGPAPASKRNTGGPFNRTRRDSGGSGRDSSRRAGGAAGADSAIIRWESAQPILDALKTPLPEDFAGCYAISVSGLPSSGGRAGRGLDEASTEAAIARQSELEGLKSVTTLAAPGKGSSHPAVVQDLPTASGLTRSVLLGFSRDSMPLVVGDHEAEFRTRIGGNSLQVRFFFEEMLYLQKLAL
jgi:hypothetical protein